MSLLRGTASTTTNTTTSAPAEIGASDAVDSYFQCITTCSLEDGDCITRCVEELRELT
jgi:hypothetical protein